MEHDGYEHVLMYFEYYKGRPISVMCKDMMGYIGCVQLVCIGQTVLCSD